MPFLCHSATRTGDAFTADFSYARRFDGKEYHVGIITFSSVTEFRTKLIGKLLENPEAYLSYLLDQHEEGR